MFKTGLLRQVARTSSTAPRAATVPLLSRQTTRGLRVTSPVSDKPSQNDDGDHHDELSTAGTPGFSEHEGRFSRTDKTIRIEHPEDHEMPSSRPVQGRGGFHFKRTLATFTLEGRVGIVTGGARGLGLVMSQALVVSGADVAIVDLNSES